MVCIKITNSKNFNKEINFEGEPEHTYQIIKYYLEIMTKYDDVKFLCKKKEIEQ